LRVVLVENGKVKGWPLSHFAPPWGRQQRLRKLGALLTSADRYATPADNLHQLTMAANIEQSAFFQQQKSKGEVIVKGILVIDCIESLTNR
jgi:hypothetical protein